MRRHGNVSTERQQGLAQVGDIGLKKSAMCEWQGAYLRGRIYCNLHRGDRLGRRH